MINPTAKVDGLTKLTLVCHMCRRKETIEKNNTIQYYNILELIRDLGTLKWQYHGEHMGANKSVTHFWWCGMEECNRIPLAPHEPGYVEKAKFSDEELDPTIESTSCILTQVAHRRLEQNKQWGGPDHDDHNVDRDWAFFITKQLGQIGYEVNDEKFRARMLDVAALAVAAIEAVDCRAAVNKFLGVKEKSEGEE